MDGEPKQVDALAFLLDASEEFVLRSARTTHAAVLDRVQSVVPKVLTGPSAVTADLGVRVHRGLAMAAYAGTSLGLKASAAGLHHHAGRGGGQAFEQGPKSRFVRSAVNGLWGDRLERERKRLAITMAVRHEGHDVELTSAGLSAAFPEATGALVVFMHGLCENESYWRKDFLDRGTTYADQLAGVGWSPVMVRTNTGLPIAANADALSALLQRVVEHWPVPVQRIALVGHSLGGLVIRAAATPDEHGTLPPWTETVTDVITLGTPHLGAPLARVIHAGSRALAKLPETAAVATFLDQRAISINELMVGLDHRVAPLPHARYRLVCATLTREPDDLLARTVGDLLVTPSSAWGHPAGADERRLRRLFPDADLLHVARAGHLDLLNHPEVGQALVGWLSAGGEQGL